MKQNFYSKQIHAAFYQLVFNVLQLISLQRHLALNLRSAIAAVFIFYPEVLEVKHLFHVICITINLSSNSAIIYGKSELLPTNIIRIVFFHYNKVPFQTGCCTPPLFGVAARLFFSPLFNKKNLYTGLYFCIPCEYGVPKKPDLFWMNQLQSCIYARDL